MKTKLVLAATTALSLVWSGSTLADDNFSNVVQTGNDNSGFVEQSGSSNEVGTPVGLGPGAATQAGNNNILTFDQSGSGNAIGTAGTGFRQDSNRNSATITQTSDGNAVLQVQQTGISSTTGGVGLRRNTLTIEQGGSDGGNTVSRVTQTRSGGFLANGEAGNSAAIIQGGSGGNIVGAETVGADGLTQTGYGHGATLSQQGTDNLIRNVLQQGNRQGASVTQDGVANVLTDLRQYGSRNSATLSFSGDDNGTSGFSLTSRIDGAWGAVSQGHVFQDNDFFLASPNLLGLAVVGSDNSYGFRQSGSGNDISGTVNGSGNAAAVQQQGISNEADFIVDGDGNLIFIDQAIAALNTSNDAYVAVTGNDNEIGARQGGTNNDATVTIANGDRNLVNLLQESLLLGNVANLSISNGDDNEIAVTQSGSSTATVTISTGDDNDVSLVQSGNNSATVSISGDTNLVTGTQTTGLLGSNALNLGITGSDNVVTTNQSISGGGLNSAGITIGGSGNHLDVSQSKSGFGAGNTLAVSITGSDNNNPSLGSFGLAPSSAVALAGGLNPGQLVQAGSGNSISLMVGNLDGNSNENRFAMSQNGNSNAIVGSINGIGNEVAVVQAGSSNFTSFSQVGNYNSIGVSQ